MSWFSGSSTGPINNLEAKIQEATSSSIPNGEIEISVALEITDIIRSKQIPAKQCMRTLKKRLTSVQGNPNLTKSVLQLIDLCVKNGGFHFLVEIATPEFVDYLCDNVFKIHYNIKDRDIQGNPAKFEVGCYIFQLLRNWSVYFKGQLQLAGVEKAYKQLVREGFKVDESVYGPSSDNIVVGEATTEGFEFIDTEVPPDWVDGEECMICYSPFSVINRKHHCRSCGGVFCQTHSSKSMPLVGLGIMEPVRVCDNCFEKRGGGRRRTGSSEARAPSRSRGTRDIVPSADDEDDDLKKAIELSLRESQIPMSRPNGPPPQFEAPPPISAPQAPQGSAPDDEEDEDMKAAIAASLREFKEKEELYQRQSAPPPEPEDNFYGDLLPSGSQYSSSNFNQAAPTNPFEQSSQFTGQSTQSSQIGNQQQFQPQQQQQTSHTTYQQPELEDLSPSEEESINLFITLMNNLKNDPAKQANILYDTNLSELHSNIITFKPKLNRSLRASLEKYETFLELNNKISTITRLYDSYLESKLAQAYGGHQISYQQQNPTGGYQYQPQQPQQQFNGYSGSQNLPESPLEPVSGYQKRQSTGYDNHVPEVGSEPPIEIQQGSPYQVRQSTGYPLNQTLPEPHADQVPLPHYQSRQSTGYPVNENESEPPVDAQYGYNNSVPPQRTSGSYPGSKVPEPMPETTFNSTPSYPPGTEVSNPPASQENTGPYPKVDYYQQQQSSSSTQIYPSFNPSEPPTGEQELQPAPSQPFSYPSSTISVPEDENEDKVAAKFPPVSDIEPKVDGDTHHEANALPSISGLPSLERIKSSQSQKLYAEEPLIEL
ncbi:vacuolar protein sorting-associated protein 27 [[Candida] railenensis]|uniref:Vacuolar protein sorting-associated protein 27 n=1 Tax=[Candida] railenensis TaxID=45579 RepID=A0A9P0QVQ3_9ASCO|nr:vacuolar protein sorting-associated protein 27 [[Candida] railenensis]